MSDNDPFNSDAWKKQTPPPYNQPNYNQPNYNQPNYNQPPAGGYQQFPPPPGNFPPYGANQYGQIDLPNAETARICGIIGICMFWNIIGIVLNIIAIVQGSNAISEYQRYGDQRYTAASFQKAKTGRTCGIVGLCILGGVFVLVVLVALVAAATS